jgi:hypothetical protein
MTERLPRYRTGRDDLDTRIVDLLEATGVDENEDLLFEIIATAVRLAGDSTERLDLKITNTALKEMRSAFKVFAPYRSEPKITMFGSARIEADDPLYVQARDLAAGLASEGWMVVTGAGPGIMASGLEGRGLLPGVWRPLPATRASASTSGFRSNREPTSSSPRTRSSCR